MEVVGSFLCLLFLCVCALVDDVLIFSETERRIEKSSRFLWMRKRVFLGTFDDVEECRVVRRCPGPHLIPHLSEMMAVLRFRDGFSVRVSDVFWSDEIPRIRAIEINRLLSGKKKIATEAPVPADGMLESTGVAQPESLPAGETTPSGEPDAVQIANPHADAGSPPPERSGKLREPG